MFPPDETLRYKTREEWLLALTAALRSTFANRGYGIPDEIYMSCGWPSTRALSTKKRRIGECWSQAATESNVHQIFISPVLSDPLEVAETLVHELGHASVGLDAKHGAPFRAFCKALGLSGKPTDTFAGPELRDILLAAVQTLGPYPHSRLDKLSRPDKKQTTRMRKISCSQDHETYILRGSASTFERGIPACPICGADMSLDEPEEPEGE